MPREQQRNSCAPYQLSTNLLFIPMACFLSFFFWRAIQNASWAAFPFLSPFSPLSVTPAKNRVSNGRYVVGTAIKERGQGDKYSPLKEKEGGKKLPRPFNIHDILR